MSGKHNVWWRFRLGEWAADFQLDADGKYLRGQSVRVVRRVLDPVKSYDEVIFVPIIFLEELVKSYHSNLPPIFAKAEEEALERD